MLYFLRAGHSSIKPGESVYNVSVRIIKKYISSARKNERGIKRDINSDYLHDYRVGLRKVRSLLSMFRGVFPEEECRTVRKKLGYIMKKTNRLRDLDVHLLEKDRFFEMAPDEFQRGLVIMFDLIREDRREAMAGVRNFLCSSGYIDIQREISGVLKRPSDAARGPDAGVGVYDYAVKRIAEHYNDAMAVALSISPESTYKDIHKLRIECKKLRYIINFFQPLFSLSEVNEILLSLEGVQDVLGRYNDLSVQIEYLSSFTSRYKLPSEDIAAVELSTAFVIESLKNLLAECREEADSQITMFTGEEAKKKYMNLFGNSG